MKKGLVLALAFVAGGSLAAPHVDHGVSGEWAIRVNPDNGNGCYMQKVFESGTVVLVGVAPDAKGAYFSAYNPEWTHIVEGDTGSVLLDFGDARFQGEVVGGTHEGSLGGYAFFDNPEFVTEFAKRQSVIITGSKGSTEEIDLSGSSKAIAAVRACQAEQT